MASNAGICAICVNTKSHEEFTTAACGHTFHNACAVGVYALVDSECPLCIIPKPDSDPQSLRLCAQRDLEERYRKIQDELQRRGDLRRRAADTCVRRLRWEKYDSMNAQSGYMLPSKMYYLGYRKRRSFYMGGVGYTTRKGIHSCLYTRRRGGPMVQWCSRDHNSIPLMEDIKWAEEVLRKHLAEQPLWDAVISCSGDPYKIDLRY